MHVASAMQPAVLKTTNTYQDTGVMWNLYSFYNVLMKKYVLLGLDIFFSRTVFQFQWQKTWVSLCFFLCLWSHSESDVDMSSQVDVKSSRYRAGWRGLQLWQENGRLLCGHNAYPYGIDEWKRQSSMSPEWVERPWNAFFLQEISSLNFHWGLYFPRFLLLSLLASVCFPNRVGCWWRWWCHVCCRSCVEGRSWREVAVFKYSESITLECYSVVSWPLFLSFQTFSSSTLSKGHDFAPSPRKSMWRQRKSHPVILSQN